MAAMLSFQACLDLVGIDQYASLSLFDIIMSKSSDVIEEQKSNGIMHEYENPADDSSPMHSLIEIPECITQDSLEELSSTYTTCSTFEDSATEIAIQSLETIPSDYTLTMLTNPPMEELDPDIVITRLDPFSDTDLVVKNVETIEDYSASDMPTTLTSLTSVDLSTCLMLMDADSCNKLNTTNHVLTSNTVSDNSSSAILKALKTTSSREIVPSVNSYKEEILSSGTILPPCKICGDKASGFHYGANTCEACKGFFRRTLQRPAKGNYKCTGNGDCEIGTDNRSCPHCRYKKCMQLGMSKDAIKTGRYTHEKRTHNIIEVKKLIRLQKELILQQEENVTELDELVSKLYDKYRETDHLLPFINNELDTKQKKHYEMYKQKSEMFGNMKTLDREEYLHFFKSTGIDIDGRQKLLSICIENFEELVKKFVSFSKAIPGFESLTVQDQVNLIKFSRFEFFFIGCERGVNIDLQVITGFRGLTFHADEIAVVFDKEFLSESFKMCKKMQNMKFTLEETAILKALVIMYTDRCELEEPEKVHKIQELLTKCLLHHIKKLRKDDKLFLPRIIDILTGLRNLTEWDKKMAASNLADYPVIQNVPLMCEFLTF